MNAGLVMALIPIFTFVVAAGAGQETFSPLRLVGVLLALAGIAMLLSAAALFIGVWLVARRPPPADPVPTT